jgi:hypothetical protein
MNFCAIMCSFENVGKAQKMNVPDEKKPAPNSGAGFQIC